MTQEELILFKELVKEAVRSAVKEAVREELNESLKKDLKEVKLLVAKSIKESRMATTQQPQAQSQLITDPTEFKNKLREAVGSDFNMRPTHPQMPKMSEEAAMNMSINGALPDFDAPIPFINKDSIAWREMKEKLG